MGDPGSGTSCVERLLRESSRTPGGGRGGGSAWCCGPPSGASQKGATLRLRLSVPPVIVEKLKTITLSATIGGSALAPETYTQPGDYTYTRDVAPALLGGESVRVDFQLDKSMPPTGADLRDLGWWAERRVGVEMSRLHRPPLQPTKR